MSVNGKVLELLAIEQDNAKWHLHTQIISFGQQMEVLWEVDAYTAQHLTDLCDFGGHHKYRLSFKTSVDSAKSQITSTVSKTYRDISNRLIFICSTEYQKQLEEIKNSLSNQDLLKLSFIHVPQTDVQVPIENVTLIPNKGKKAIKWASIGLISAVFLLFGYSTYLNKPVDSKTVNAEIKTAEVHLAEASSTLVATAYNDARAEELAEQPYFPYVEMTDLVNYNISANDVALTFDDGPTKFTTAIVDTLKKYEVGGTFFFIGNKSKKHPDTVQYVYSNGYSIGSHSMKHDNMVKFTYEQQETDLLQTTAILEGIIEEDVNLYRPPYGSVNQLTENLVHSYNKKIVLWDKDTKDWQTRDAQKIIQYVKSIDATGSIILLHESQAVVDALPIIIEHLQQNGLNIVNLK